MLTRASVRGYLDSRFLWRYFEIWFAPAEYLLWTGVMCRLASTWELPQCPQSRSHQYREVLWAFWTSGTDLAFEMLDRNLLDERDWRPLCLREPPKASQWWSRRQLDRGIFILHDSSVHQTELISVFLPHVVPPRCSKNHPLLVGSWRSSTCLKWSGGVTKTQCWRPYRYTYMLCVLMLMSHCELAIVYYL